MEFGLFLRLLCCWCVGRVAWRVLIQVSSIVMTGKSSRTSFYAESCQNGINHSLSTLYFTTPHIQVFFFFFIDSFFFIFLIYIHSSFFSIDSLYPSIFLLCIHSSLSLPFLSLLLTSHHFFYPFSAFVLFGNESYLARVFASSLVGK